MTLPPIRTRELLLARCDTFEGFDEFCDFFAMDVNEDSGCCELADGIYIGRLDTPYSIFDVIINVAPELDDKPCRAESSYYHYPMLIEHETDDLDRASTTLLPMIVKARSEKKTRVNSLCDGQKPEFYNCGNLFNSISRIDPPTNSVTFGCVAN